MPDIEDPTLGGVYSQRTKITTSLRKKHKRQGGAVRDKVHLGVSYGFRMPGMIYVPSVLVSRNRGEGKRKHKIRNFIHGVFKKQVQLRGKVFNFCESFRVSLP